MSRMTSLLRTSNKVGRLPFLNRPSVRQWRLQSQLCQFPLSRKRLFSTRPNIVGDPAELATRSQNMLRYSYFYQGVHSTIASKILQLTPDKPSLKVVDIACGNADCSEYLLDHKDTLLNKSELSILGLDNSQTVLTRTQDRLVTSNKTKYLDSNGSDGASLKLQYADAYDVGMSYKDNFDVGVANFVFNYCSNTDDLFFMFQSCYDCLKSDGFFIGVLPIILNKEMLRVLDTEESKDELKNQFGWIHEFRKHRGTPYMSEKELEELPLVWKVSSAFNDGFKRQFYTYELEVLDKVAKNVGFSNGIEIVDNKEFVFLDEDFAGEKDKQDSEKFWTQTAHPYQVFVMRK